jgi:hypothetical protein
MCGEIENYIQNNMSCIYIILYNLCCQIYVAKFRVWDIHYEPFPANYLQWIAAEAVQDNRNSLLLCWDILWA